MYADGNYNASVWRGRVRVDSMQNMMAYSRSKRMRSYMGTMYTRYYSRQKKCRSTERNGNIVPALCAHTRSIIGHYFVFFQQDYTESWNHARFSTDSHARPCPQRRHTDSMMKYGPGEEIIKIKRF